MKLSKYDTNHDGICDAKACKNVFTITGDRAVEKGFIPVLEQNLKSIGITLKDRVLKDAYTPIQTVAPEHPVLDAARLGQGLRRRRTRSSARSSTAATSSRRATRTTRSPRASRPRRPRSSASRATSPASRASTPTSTSASTTRRQRRASRCYAALDKKLTTQVVPWVPYLWSSYARPSSSKNVTKWEFDQFSGTIAYAHVAVK